LLTVNGQPLSVDLGETGEGILTLDQPGRYLVATDGLAPIAFDVWEGAWEGPDAARVPDGPGGPAAHAWGGDDAAWVAWGAPGAWTSLWWIPADGSPSPILQLPEGTTLQGGATADLDGDPWPDVVAWGPEGVALLRGVEAGPPVFAARLRATLSIVDLAIGDADGDGRDDLAAAFIEGDSRTVEVLRADNLLRFPLLHRVELLGDPAAIALGWDSDTEGPLLDVINTDSRFDHYLLDDEEGFVLGGSHDPVVMPDRTSLIGGHDFNADGAGRRSPPRGRHPRPHRPPHHVRGAHAGRRVGERGRRRRRPLRRPVDPRQQRGSPNPRPRRRRADRMERGGSPLRGPAGGGPSVRVGGG
jgi:hypothetical protein